MVREFRRFQVGRDTEGILAVEVAELAVSGHGVGQLGCLGGAVLAEDAFVFREPEHPPLEIAVALDHAHFDFVARLELIRVVGDQFLVGGGPLGGKQEQAFQLGHVDDARARAVFETGEAGLHFADLGFRAGALLGFFCWSANSSAMVKTPFGNRDAPPVGQVRAWLLSLA